MATFLYSEINIICMIMTLIVASQLMTSSSGASLKSRWFNAVVWSVFFANLCDLIWGIITVENISIPVFLAYLINFLYFETLGVGAYGWFVYCEAVRMKNASFSKKQLGFYAIPLIVLTVLLVISYFNGMIFSIDENGDYNRGEYFFLQPLLSYIYTFTAIFVSAASSAKKKHHHYKNRLVMLSVCTIFICLSAVLQFVTSDLPLVTVATSLSIVYVYINSLERMVSLDPLTGISNRRELFTHFSDAVKSLKHEEKLYLLFIDVDSFKQINDTYGHGTGDLVLKCISASVRRFCSETGGFCARFGGDEIVVMQILKNDNNISVLCDELKRQIIDNYEPIGDLQSIDVSIGFSEYDGGDISELISRADEKMYKEKEEKRANTAV